MKVLLISPIIDQPEVDPPIGLCYLQAYLDKMGFTDNKIICLLKSYDKIRKEIEEFNPDVVGVSCFTEFRRSSFKITKLAKEINPKIKVVLGGPHATYMAEQIMNNFPSVDFIVMGEGEITFYELLDSLSNNNDSKKVKGIIFRENGKIIRTEARPYIQNLDELPYPSYRDIDFSNYEVAKPPEYFKKMRKASIVSSRGCVFDCNFCSTTKFWTRKWRPRKPKNVVDEIEFLKKTYNIKFFQFFDDILSVDKNRVITICQEIIDRNLNIIWYAETRVNCISKDMLDWMKRAGCFMVQFGVESGSETILKNMNKMITPTQIIDAFKMTKESEIKTEMLLMIGYPGETQKTINETKHIIDITNPDMVVVSITKVLPSTQLYEYAKKIGFIDDSYWLTEKTAPEYTVDYTMNQLLSMRLDMMKFFYNKKGKFAFYLYLWGVFKNKPRILTDHLKVYLLGKERLVE